MSAAGAIEAGQSFVRFFGDMTDLFKTMREGGKELSAWSAQVSNDAGNTLAGGFSTASNAATAFGAASSSATATASHGLQSVSGNAIAAAGKVSLVGSAFNLFKGAGAGLGGLIGGLAGVAKMAYSLSWYLRGTSIVMGWMGKDAKHLEPWIKNLAKVSWAAWGVDKALKAASLTARAARGIALAPFTLAGMAGRGLGRIGRMGGFGAAVAGSTMMGESQEDDPASGKKVVAGGAAAGLMMGGVVGAGVGAAIATVGLMIKKSLSDVKDGTQEAGGFLSELVYKMLAFGQWIGTIFGKAKDSVVGAFKGMGAGSGTFLKDVERALFPIFDSVEKIWLPAFGRGMDWLANLFKSNTDSMSRTWSGFIVDSIGVAADFIGNIDLYFQYGQELITLWASNSIVQVSDFFTNAGSWIKWFGENWFSVLTDMASFQQTVFSNIVVNLKDNFRSLWEWVKGGMRGDIDFKWTDLTASFESTIKEWPKMVSSELEKSSPRMDQITAQLAARQAQQSADAENWEGLKYTPKSEEKKAEKDRKERTEREEEFDSKYGATAAGSQEAYAALARLQNSGGGNAQITELKGMKAELAKQTRFLEKTVDVLNKDGKGRVWSIS